MLELRQKSNVQKSHKVRISRMTQEGKYEGLHAREGADIYYTCT
jgi:hypothetical protein